MPNSAVNNCYVITIGGTTRRGSTFTGELVSANGGHVKSNGRLERRRSSGSMSARPSTAGRRSSLPNNLPDDAFSPVSVSFALKILSFIHMTGFSCYFALFTSNLIFLIYFQTFCTAYCNEMKNAIFIIVRFWSCFSCCVQLGWSLANCLALKILCS